MTRTWKLGIRICLAICASGLIVGICVHRLKQRRLVQAANLVRGRAEKGDAKAQRDLGSRYFYGTGVPQDYVEAVRWYRKAAEQGEVLAEFSLGLMYVNGQGVPQDYTEAALWYHKAAERGNPKSQFSLASLYFYGKGVTQDYTEAARWSRKAAEQGEALAEFGLGSMYLDGKGVQQDYAEAISWFRKAAYQGNAEAEYSLGYMYYNGEGLPRDYKEAVRWYRESAKHGYPDAQLALRSLEGKSTTTKTIDYSVLFIALVSAFIFLVDLLRPGGHFRNSLNSTALGVVCLCYAGLHLYGMTHENIQYSACRNSFYLAKGITIGMVIILAMRIIMAPRRKSTEVKPEAEQLQKLSS